MFSDGIITKSIYIIHIVYVVIAFGNFFCLSFFCAIIKNKFVIVMKMIGSENREK